MFNQPLIAVDVVPIRFTGQVEVGTAVRARAPFAGAHALPGVLLGAGELLATAATRALAAKAGVDPGDIRHAMQVGAFDQPGRDPREHAISVGFVIVITPDAQTDLRWTPLAGPQLHLPFDHDTIITQAREVLRPRIWVDQQLTQALTGQVFPFTAAQAVEEELTGVRPHQGSLRRQLLADPRIEKLETLQITGQGRPTTVWRWV